MKRVGDGDETEIMRESEKYSDNQTEFQRMGDGMTMRDDQSVMRLAENESEDSSMKFGSKGRERPLSMRSGGVKGSIRSSKGNVLEDANENKVAKPPIR